MNCIDFELSIHIQNISLPKVDNPLLKKMDILTIHSQRQYMTLLHFVTIDGFCIVNSIKKIRYVGDTGHSDIVSQTYILRLFNDL